jgi:hypothetical protein
VPEEVVDQAWAALDADGDGVVTYEEFAGHMLQHGLDVVYV